MTTFTRDEIVPSTKVARNLSSLLNKLKSHQLEKVAVIRNNEMEAVLLPVHEYELMQALLEKDEYREIYTMVKERETTQLTDYISFDSVLKNFNIKHENL